MDKKILFYTSDRFYKVSENDTAETHFRLFPYSLGAIRYNLERLGWTTCWVNLKTAKSLLRTTRRIDTFQPSIIYTYGGTVALNPLFSRRFLCNHKRFKVIHGWDDVYGEIWEDVFGKIPGIFMRWMEKRIIKNSDNIITLSHYNQSRARKWGIECHYIPNGADIPQIDTIQNAIQLTGTFNLVYTGDMARWKRTYEICEAMRYLPKNVKLYLTGPYYSYLDKYKSDNCIFLGYLPKQVQLNVMAQASAFVVTADQDCNAKIQEYLRFKKPILGYDGRLNLFFQNNRNALLTSDYVSAIKQLVSDKSLCNTLVKNAEHDITVYSWLEIAQQFNDYFEQAMKTPH